MATKKPDSKSIVYYQAVTAGIRNAARSRFIFRLTLTCLFCSHVIYDASFEAEFLNKENP